MQQQFEHLVVLLQPRVGASTFLGELKWHLNLNPEPATYLIGAGTAQKPRVMISLAAETLKATQILRELEECV